MLLIPKLITFPFFWKWILMKVLEYGIKNIDSALHFCPDEKEKKKNLNYFCITWKWVIYFFFFLNFSTYCKFVFLTLTYPNAIGTSFAKHLLSGCQKLNNNHSIAKLVKYLYFKNGYFILGTQYILFFFSWQECFIWQKTWSIHSFPLHPFPPLPSRGVFMFLFFSTFLNAK